MIPVAIAAVGDAMLRVAGQVADGERLHPLCSRRYLEEVCLPRLAEGMLTSGRRRENFDVHGGGFVVTGPNEEAVAAGMETVRGRVAFYGSTPAYAPILALHGLEELGRRLHRLSVEGRWREMAALVSDDVVRIFAACGTYDTIAGEVERRFGGAADSIDLDFPPDAPFDVQQEVLSQIHRIPHAFIGFDTMWND
jgi:probable F420-dependent oxidoreductase